MVKLSINNKQIEVENGTTILQAARKFGINIPKISSGVKNTCVVAIDKSTGINLFGININIKSIKY